MTPVEERIDHEEAKRIAEAVGVYSADEETSHFALIDKGDYIRAATSEEVILARAYLALLTEHSAREEALGVAKAGLRGIEHAVSLEHAQRMARQQLAATEPAQPEEERRG